METIAALLCYASAWSMIFFSIKKKKQARKRFLGVIALGILAHSIAAVALIQSDNGFVLSLLNVSLVLFAVMNSIVLISSLRLPLQSLFLLLLPFSCLSLASTAFFSSGKTFAPNLSLTMLAHILLSIIAYSLLTIAALQALLLAYQNRSLRDHHARAVIGVLPPLQTMESLLFYLIWAGFLLLSLSILSGLLFIEDVFAQRLSHKLVFSVLSWLIYATLLCCRHFLGWRGQTAIRWALAGFAMLMLAYFGSKFVLEVLVA